jgi:hypothetical protein
MVSQSSNILEFIKSSLEAILNKFRKAFIEQVPKRTADRAYILIDKQFQAMIMVSHAHILLQCY